MVDKLIDALRSVEELGVIAIAILDSSFLSIPEVNDLILIANIAEQPHLVFYWPLLTALGSVLGCFMLYWLMRKGGYAFLHRWFPSQRVKSIEKLFAQYGSLVLIIPALCPPPTPFKIFVASAGALQFPVKRFLLTIFLARSVRYYAAGILAVVYGKKVEVFIKEHTLLVVGVVAVVVLIAFFVSRLLEARLRMQATDPPHAPKDEKLCA
jgi:membrane protein YqaA with SNARE-associated domain